MSDPLTFDIRIWLTESLYAGLVHKAKADDRSLSAYVRRLIQRDLDESLEPLEIRHYAPAGSTAGRNAHA